MTVKCFTSLRITRPSLLRHISESLVEAMIEKNEYLKKFFRSESRHRHLKIESDRDFLGTGRGSLVRKVDVKSRTRPFVFAICVRVVDKVGKESPLFNCCHECFIEAVADRIAAV
ncbi:hypothetical protein CDAR_213251 [Caerostris darwini]|uniref:Uncharacterized protein n=1 Tax=Caerostris darwini TaxID=1538125 RepID=A0AAV4PYJ0_9ARAC|nr:hypothetical protein CDAR_213251 [Caerostris darwini]